MVGGPQPASPGALVSRSSSERKEPGACRALFSPAEHAATLYLSTETARPGEAFWANWTRQFRGTEPPGTRETERGKPEATQRPALCSSRSTRKPGRQGEHQPAAAPRDRATQTPRSAGPLCSLSWQPGRPRLAPAAGLHPWTTRKAKARLPARSSLCGWVTQAVLLLRHDLGTTMTLGQLAACLLPHQTGAGLGTVCPLPSVPVHPGPGRGWGQPSGQT